MRVTTTYGELRNGDRIYLEGYLFRVANLERYPSCPLCRYDCLKADHVDRIDVIRFSGHVVDRTADIAGTAYDGDRARYGARADVRATIERD